MTSVPRVIEVRLHGTPLDWEIPKEIDDVTMSVTIAIYLLAFLILYIIAYKYDVTDRSKVAVSLL